MNSSSLTFGFVVSFIIGSEVMSKLGIDEVITIRYPLVPSARHSIVTRETVSKK